MSGPADVQDVVGGKANNSLFDLTHSEVISSIGVSDRKHYEKFCQKRVSSLTVGSLLIWFAVCSIYILVTAIIYAKDKIIFIVIAASFILIRNPMFVIIICLKLRGKVDANKAKTFMANVSTVMSAICLGLFLVGRVINGECQDYDFQHMWSCNPEHSSQALPQDVLFSLLFIPIIVSTIFKSVKLVSVIVAWFCVIFFTGLAIGLTNAHRSLPLLIFYIPVSLVMIYENYRQDIILFLISSKKDALLEDNKRLSEEAQTELRFMIANMAHDLKTPLSAFMNGIETLKSLFLDIKNPSNTLDMEQTLHNQINENIKNLFNVNQFMTMTVNRCIDYMKASKGIKLEPRLETINLQEVLSMPLNCMRDLQSRIAIMQKPIPGSVCSHIITDLQWFQENLFCLISNAVKYSSHGHISVSVALIPNNHEKVSGARLKKASAKFNFDDKASSFSGSRRESYSFLDRLVAVSRSAAKIRPMDGTAAVTDESAGPTCRQEDADIEATMSSDPLWRMESGMVGSRSTKSSTSTNSGGGTARKSRVYALSGSVLSIDTRASYTIFEEEDANKEEFLLIEVEDTGIGLSDEAKEKLFTPFKQAQRRAGGTGLGLYSLAKRVDALGGYYGVSNRRDGEQGSIFWFAIPYRPDTTSMGLLMRAISKNMEGSPTRPDGSPNRPEGSVGLLAVSEKISVSTVPLSPAASAASAATLTLTTAAAMKKLRVLLVDDSHTILKMTSNLLKRHGHVVDQEENGADALTRLDKARGSDTVYDVMLIDLNMPVMDGLEAMKRLRETERQLSVSSAVPVHQCVFAFTANSDRETMLEALGAGADDFISKPFSMQTFNEKYLMLKAGEMMMVEEVA